MVERLLSAASFRNVCVVSCSVEGPAAHIDLCLVFRCHAFEMEELGSHKDRQSLRLWHLW